jgi:3-hydroxymyristoyl/3-hydroxydecanoyl-(acyl carrier protein) dehydratase
MEAPHKPKIIKQFQNGDKLRLILWLQPELIYFQGHFHNFPVLPGVTELDWVIFYGQTLLNCPKVFAGMEMIKFQVPILPKSTIELTLDWVQDKQKLYFKYMGATSKDDKQYSSGRIMLVDNE